MKLARRLGWALGIIALLYVGYAVLFTWFQRQILFPRHLVAADPHAGDGITGLERLHLPVPGGQVEAWLMLGDGCTASTPGPLVIFAHGNGEVIDHWGRALSPYRRMGVSVLLAEYRGYGRSAGEPSQENITADYERFYDLVSARPEVDRQRIVFHGRSLGGGVVGALAARRAPAAMILQSTFTSVASFATQFMLPAFLVADPFDTESVIQTLGVPILVIHGTRDQVVPYHHGQRLAKASKNARLITYDAGHNDLPPDEAEYFQALHRFFTEHQLL